MLSKKLGAILGSQDVSCRRPHVLAQPAAHSLLQGWWAGQWRVRPARHEVCILRGAGTRCRIPSAIPIIRGVLLQTCSCLPGSEAWRRRFLGSVDGSVGAGCGNGKPLPGKRLTRPKEQNCKSDWHCSTDSAQPRAGRSRRVWTSKSVDLHASVAASTPRQCNTGNGRHLWHFSKRPQATSGNYNQASAPVADT